MLTISANEHVFIRAQQVPLRGREELRVNLGTRHRPHSTISNRHDGTTNPRRTKRPTNPRPINNRLNRNTTVRIHRLTSLPRAILLAPRLKHTMREHHEEPALALIVPLGNQQRGPKVTRRRTPRSEERRVGKEW